MYPRSDRTGFRSSGPEHPDRPEHDRARRIRHRARHVWNTSIIAAWGASNASAVTYLTPVVGVLLGILILDEPLTWNQPAGAALVVLGILAAHGRLSPRRTREPAKVEARA